MQVLRVLQLNALQDRCVASRGDWDAAVQLMESALKQRLAMVDADLKALTGTQLSVPLFLVPLLDKTTYTDGVALRSRLPGALAVLAVHVRRPAAPR